MSPSSSLGISDIWTLGNHEEEKLKSVLKKIGFVGDGWMELAYLQDRACFKHGKGNTSFHKGGGFLEQMSNNNRTPYMSFLLIFMEPCIVVWLVAITNKMQRSNGILLFHSTLIVQHVSSVMSLIIRNLNSICSFWFTYACGDRPLCRLSGNWPTDCTTGGLHKRM